MERLDLIHHKTILLVILLVTLITGVIFGVKISATTRGTDGLLIIVFAMLFVIMAISFVMFTQIIHLREEVRTLNQTARTEHGTTGNPSSTQRVALAKSIAPINPKRRRR